MLFFVLSSLLSSAAVGYAWRDERFAWVGIFGIGLFLLAQWRYQKLLHVFAHGLLTGYVGFLIANPWMLWTVGGLMDASPVTVFATVQGIHLFHGGMWCLFAVMWWFTRRFLYTGWVLAPAIWLILESFYPAMFPMRQGCLLIGIKPLIQIASVFGVAGVTLQAFLLASLLPLIWFAAKKAEEECSLSESDFAKGLIHPRVARHSIVGIVVLTVLNFSWGAFRIHEFESAERQFQGERLEVLLVQGDTEYADFHYNMMERSRKHTDDCELVLWPECSLGHYSRSLSSFSDDGEIIMNSIGIGNQFRPLPDPNCYLLAAGYSWTRRPDQEKLESKFVSAYLLDTEEKMVGRHDKIELMAGGEFMPGEEWFTKLTKWLYGDEEVEEDGDDPEDIPLSRGGVALPIGSVGDVSVAVMLCCEDMYPWLSREMTNEGADLLVCLANGMCFDSEIVLQQHFAISLFRAIENNRYFVRCGSFGVSGLVSPTGALSSTAPCFEEVDLRLSIPVEDRANTLFDRCGDTLTYTSYGCLLGFGIFSLVTRFRSH